MQSMSRRSLTGRSRASSCRPPQLTEPRLLQTTAQPLQPIVSAAQVPSGRPPLELTELGHVDGLNDSVAVPASTFLQILITRGPR